MKKNKLPVIIVIVIALIIIGVFAFFSLRKDKNEYTNPADKIIKAKLGKEVEYSGFKITFSKDYKIIKNEITDIASDYKYLIKIPVTVVNNREDDTIFPEYIIGFIDPDNKALIDNYNYFFDNSISKVGSFKKGKSYKTYYYIPYTKNGKYKIQFHDYINNTYEIKFKVKK